MPNILLLSAHPTFEKSKLNRSLLSAAGSISGITIHDLYEEYPYFDINVNRERELLQQHKTIVLQHPLFWYSTPSLVTEWFDQVLEYDWGYRSGGAKLIGKKFLQVVTADSNLDVQKDWRGYQNRIPQFLRPVERTSALCGMEWLPPFIFHESSEASEHPTNQYIEILEGLRDDSLKLGSIPEYSTLCI